MSFAGSIRKNRPISLKSIYFYSNQNKAEKTKSGSMKIITEKSIMAHYKT